MACQQPSVVQVPPLPASKEASVTTRAAPVPSRRLASSTPHAGRVPTSLTGAEEQLVVFKDSCFASEIFSRCQRRTAATMQRLGEWTGKPKRSFPFKRSEERGGEAGKLLVGDGSGWKGVSTPQLRVERPWQLLAQH